jgi:uncharacterized membrane protein (GlpM family)
MPTELILKVVFTVAVVLGATELGKALPKLSGLIATMPLTALMVMIWLNVENPDKAKTMVSYSGGAFWGVIPSMLFYGAAYTLYRRGFGLPAVIGLSFVVWGAAAVVHQMILGSK